MFATKILCPKLAMLSTRRLFVYSTSKGRTSLNRFIKPREDSLPPSRCLKTTPATNVGPAIGPVLVKLATPLYRFGFMYIGRRFRRYWNDLPRERKSTYVNLFTKSKRGIYGGVLLVGGFSTIYFVSHLEETPVTKRRRFMILNSNQLEEVAKVEWRNLDESLDKNKLPVHDPRYQKVYKIVKRILVANQSKEVNALKWEVNVVDSEEVNAFVMANGKIYVFTGMLKAIHNDNELAGVIGHEIAHAILNHSAETLSLSGFFNIFSLALVTMIWTVIPSDGVALIASVAQDVVEDLLVNLPYSRKLESEADEVGLLLAARACYDVRYVPRFWHRMHLQGEGDLIHPVFDWFSTHPTNVSRVQQIDGLLPEALELRRFFKCPELKEFYESTQRYRLTDE